MPRLSWAVPGMALSVALPAVSLGVLAHHGVVFHVHAPCSVLLRHRG